jgi:hypothetical protein
MWVCSNRPRLVSLDSSGTDHYKHRYVHDEYRKPRVQSNVFGFVV